MSKVVKRKPSLHAVCIDPKKKNTLKKYRKVEYVQRRVCFINVQSSLHVNVVFSVHARMGNAAYIIFIMWNSTSGLEAWYHFQFNNSCGLAVMGRSYLKKNQVIF